MGFSIGQGFQSALGAGNASAKANNLISKTNAETGNRVRAAENLAASAQGNLQRFTQSVNNNRALDAGGRALEALNVNTLRGGDANLRAGFSANIRSAEAMGHMAASAAVAGVGGSVVDSVNQSTALRDSIVKQSVADNVGSASWDESRRAGNIMSQIVGGLDSSIILDHMDYNVQTAQTSPVLGMFARTLQGFFPAGTDALGAFKDAGNTLGSKVTSAYDTYQDRKTGNASYNPNASPSSNNADFSYNYDANSTSMVNSDYNPADFGISSDGYGGDDFDFGSF
jgi:hypothetical protein